jgi:hypothetical protein
MCIARKRFDEALRKCKEVILTLRNHARDPGCEVPSSEWAKWKSQIEQLIVSMSNAPGEEMASQMADFERFSPR